MNERKLHRLPDCSPLELPNPCESCGTQGAEKINLAAFDPCIPFQSLLILLVFILTMRSMHCSRGKDGKPTFERTGTVGGTTEPLQQDDKDDVIQDSPGARDPWRTPSYSSSSPSWTPYRPSSAAEEYSAFRQRRAEQAAEAAFRQRYSDADSGYVPSVECVSTAHVHACCACIVSCRRGAPTWAALFHGEKGYSMFSNSILFQFRCIVFANTMHPNWDDCLTAARDTKSLSE
jgi:hypothetical protein